MNVRAKGIRELLNYSMKTQRNNLNILETIHTERVAMITISKQIYGRFPSMHFSLMLVTRWNEELLSFTLFRNNKQLTIKKKKIYKSNPM